MKFTVRAFRGMRPGIQPDNLSVGEATLARNAVLEGGDLDPLRAASLVTSLTPTASVVRTIYRFLQTSASDTQFWFQSANDVQFVKGPIDGDTEERTYYTGHLAYPTKTRAGATATATPPYPTTSIPMGLYKPAVAPSVSVTGTATDPNSTAEDVTFICTLVTDWGEEGPPSDPSAIVTWRTGQTLQVSLPTAGAPSYPGNTTKSGQVYTGKRLYRSATGASGAARWLLVNTEGDIPLATASYSTTKPTAQLGEALRTRGWIEPPDDMRGLVAMANGVLAGYSGNTVCFSEPGYPYAWPVRYQQTVDAPIVAMQAFGQSLLVSTTRGLTVFTGPDPASITSERIQDPQISLSNRAMVPMLGGIVFPTPDGLGYVGPGGFKMLSEGLFTHREWTTYSAIASSLHAYEYDGRYILFYDNGSEQGSMIFKFGDEASLTLSTVYATAGFRDPGRDALFLCVNGAGTVREVRKWDAGANLTATWTSGVIRLMSPTNFGAGRIVADGPVTFEILADGVVQGAAITVTDSMPFRLPAGYRTLRAQARITTSSVVRSLELADTVRNLLGD